MGITIHFSLKTSQPNIRKLIEQLHSAAQDLSFEAVGEIIELVGEQCLHQPSDSEDLSIMKIKAVARTIEEGTIRQYQCDRIIGFTVYPGQGCEFLPVFLAHYPSFGRHWQSESSCKTQFAASLSLPHFITCHTAIISLLDKAAALNLLDESEESPVVDEAEFWQHRDIARLVQAVQFLSPLL
jgi:hypothetical protein